MPQKAAARARRPARLAGALRRPGQLAAWLLGTEERAQPDTSGLLLDILLAGVAVISVVVTLGKARPCAALDPFGRCMVPLITVQQPFHHVGDLVAGALTTAPLAIRRIRPLTGFWIIVAAAVIAPTPADNIVTMVAFVVAAYSAVVHSRYRRLALVSVPLAGILVATSFPSVALPLTLPGRATAFLALIPVVLFGQAVHQWRSRAGASQQRLDELQREHEVATQNALAQERARIASELHDVVTHNVSVMIVQAGAARHVLAEAPGDARAALLAVEASGRAAMAELRHLLGLLSPVGAAVSGDELTGPAAADLQPQPGVRQLPALIGRVRATGLAVSYREDGAPPDLAPGLDLTGYRIVQEALTNVIKHAGPTTASVRVDYRDGDLTVTVADAGPGSKNGPGGRAGPAGLAGPAAGGQLPEPGSGRGLLGLRERVALYGGELSAGPTAAGGWLVQARLPANSPAPPALAEAGPPPASAVRR